MGNHPPGHSGVQWLRVSIGRWLFLSFLPPLPGQVPPTHTTHTPHTHQKNNRVPKKCRQTSGQRPLCAVLLSLFLFFTGFSRPWVTSRVVTRGRMLGCARKAPVSPAPFRCVWFHSFSLVLSGWIGLGYRDSRRRTFLSCDQPAMFPYRERL